MSVVSQKPCAGEFSAEVQQLLAVDMNRETWQHHKCLTCGQSVTARFEKGKWIPDTHFRSVKYPSRTTARKGQRPTSKAGRKQYSRQTGEEILVQS